MNKIERFMFCFRYQNVKECLQSNTVYHKVLSLIADILDCGYGFYAGKSADFWYFLCSNLSIPSQESCMPCRSQSACSEEVVVMRRQNTIEKGLRVALILSKIPSDQIQTELLKYAEVFLKMGADLIHTIDKADAEVPADESSRTLRQVTLDN